MTALYLFHVGISTISLYQNKKQNFFLFWYKQKTKLYYQSNRDESFI